MEERRMFVPFRLQGDCGQAKREQQVSQISRLQTESLQVGRGERGLCDNLRIVPKAKRSSPSGSLSLQPLQMIFSNLKYNRIKVNLALKQTCAVYTNSRRSPQPGEVAVTWTVKWTTKGGSSPELRRVKVSLEETKSGMAHCQEHCASQREDHGCHRFWPQRPPGHPVVWEDETQCETPVNNTPHTPEEQPEAQSPFP